MRKKARLVQMLCQPFCGYYRPGRNEELLCRGAQVVDRLIAAGMTWPINASSAAVYERTTADQTSRHVCSACDFRAQDCDFARDKTALPCGGFILITRLLATGALTVEKLG